MNYQQKLKLVIYKNKNYTMSIILKNSQLNDDTISALNTLIDLDINAQAAFRLMRIIKELSSILAASL